MADIPLSDSQLRESLTALNVPIIDYDTLRNYGSLTELFSKVAGTNKLIVLFCRNKEQEVGHWQLLLYRDEGKKLNKFEHFCSLGFEPDEFQKLFSHGETYIKDLVRSNEHLSYTPHRFQEVSSNLCGRYVLHRALACKLDCEQYYELLLKLQPIFGSADEFMRLTIGVTND